jgi:hypothetical protein
VHVQSEILDVAAKVKAEGMTTNAAALIDIYEQVSACVGRVRSRIWLWSRTDIACAQKRVFRTVLMVTDEDENGTVTVNSALRTKDNAGCACGVFVRRIDVYVLAFYVSLCTSHACAHTARSTLASCLPSTDARCSRPSLCS